MLNFVLRWLSIWIYNESKAKLDTTNKKKLDKTSRENPHYFNLVYIGMLASTTKTTREKS